MTRLLKSKERHPFARCCRRVRLVPFLFLFTWSTDLVPRRSETIRSGEALPLWKGSPAVGAADQTTRRGGRRTRLKRAEWLRSGHFNRFEVGLVVEGKGACRDSGHPSRQIGN